MYTIVTKVCIHVELDPVTHGTSNLDHYCTSYMSKKLQNDHVFYMYIWYCMYLNIIRFRY